MNAYDVSSNWALIVLVIALAVIVGILAVKLVKVVVIISTSFSGAASIVRNVLGLFNVSNYIVILSLTRVVAVLGMIYQFSHNKHKTPDKSDSTAISEQEQTAPAMLPSEENAKPKEQAKLPDEEVWIDAPNSPSDNTAKK